MGFEERNMRKTSHGIRADKSKIDLLRLIFVFLATLLSFGLVFQSYAVLNLKSQEADLLEKIAQEEIYREKLEKEIAYLSTHEAVEQIAREELGYIMPGEQRIIQQNTNS